MSSEQNYTHTHAKSDATATYPNDTQPFRIDTAAKMLKVCTEQRFGLSGFQQT